MREVGSHDPALSAPCFSRAAAGRALPVHLERHAMSDPSKKLHRYRNALQAAEDCRQVLVTYRKVESLWWQSQHSHPQFPGPIHRAVDRRTGREVITPECQATIDAFNKRVEDRTAELGE